MAKKKDLTIEQGKTFRLVIRWEDSTFVYKAISNIANVAPVLITCAGHGIPDGWNVAVVSVGNMTQINALNDPPKDTDYLPATVVDINTIELNAVNAARFTAYIPGTSGGYLQYRFPHSLAGAIARMKIKDKVGGSTLLELTSEVSNARIVIDDAAKTITLTVSAVDTAAIGAWHRGVYDLEVEEADGTVTALLTGAVLVEREVTTTA